MKIKHILLILCALAIPLMSYFVHSALSTAPQENGKTKTSVDTTGQQAATKETNEIIVSQKSDLQDPMAKAKRKQELANEKWRDAKKRILDMTPEQRQEMARKAREKALARNSKQMKARRDNMDKDYAELFRRFNLSDAEVDTLKDMIIELEFANRNAWSDSRFSPGEQRPSHQEVMAVSDEYKKKANSNIRELLGEEKFNMVTHYMETVSDRRDCEVLISRFPYEAEPLAPEAKDLLVDVMYDLRKMYDAALRKNAEAIRNETGKVPAINHAERIIYMKNGILEQAQSILTPAQLKSVENWFNDHIPTSGNSTKSPQ